MERKTEMDDRSFHEERGEFYLPIRRKIPQKTKFRCRHCNANYFAEYAVDCCWPDRKYGSKQGMVVICQVCGCRQSLESTKTLSIGTGKEGSASGEREKPRISWISVLILSIMAVVTAAVMLLFWVSRDRVSDVSGNDVDSASKPASVSTLETVDDNDSTAVIATPETLIRSTQMGNIGNLFINISEGGLMQIAGDRVYYTNPEDSYRIYSMDLNFEERRLECDIPSFYLNYRDNAMIFSGADGGEKNLFRMELDSGDVTLLSEQSTYEPKVVGDTIFYDDKEENYSLYRCNLDGSDRTIISPGVVFYSCIVDDTIYYLDTQDDYYLYSMDLDGGSKQVLLNQSVRKLSVLGNTLYLAMREGGIFSYQIDTGEIQQISDLSVSSLVAAEDGWLYFAYQDRGERLYKMTVEGEKLTKLSNEPAEYINVVSNLICFKNKDTGAFYWMLTDGSYYQLIQ